MQTSYEPTNPPPSDIVGPTLSTPRKKPRIPKKLQHIPPLNLEHVFTRQKSVSPTRRRKLKKPGSSRPQHTSSDLVPGSLHAALSDGSASTTTWPGGVQPSQAVNFVQDAAGYLPPPSPVSAHVYIDNTVGITQDAEHLVYSPRDICYLFPHLEGQATSMGSAPAHGEHCTTQTCPDMYTHSLYVEDNSPSTASSVYGDEQLSYSPNDAFYSPLPYGQGYPPSMGTSSAMGFQQVDQFPNIASPEPIYPLGGIRGVGQFCYDDSAYQSFPSNEEPCPLAMPIPMEPSVPYYPCYEDAQFPTGG